jgi:peptide/nickel transport system substrate-binding protein
MSAVRTMRRGALVASTIITLALTVPFASVSRPAQAQDYPIEEINWAIANVNETMFAPHAWSVAVGAVMALVQEGPLAFGDDLSLQAGVCDSWDHPDPLTYVYHLRPGVTFHDGSPVTPDDIVASMTYHLDPDNRSQLGAFYSTVESIEATGDDEVTVKLSSPNVQFQYTVAHMAGFIFKKAPAATTIGVQFEPADQAEFEAAVLVAKEGLGEAPFKDVYDEGFGWTREGAVAFARHYNEFRNKELAR